MRMQRLTVLDDMALCFSEALQLRLPSNSMPLFKASKGICLFLQVKAETHARLATRTFHMRNRSPLLFASLLPAVCVPQTKERKADLSVTKAGSLFFAHTHQVFHHEQAQTPFWPSKIFFFCETPAETGGATGVCPSYEVARILEERHPEFVKKLEAVGVKYTSYMASVDDPTKV